MAQPHFIELDEAVSRIKQACDDRENDSHHPFFFMVGAGLSYPSVPLAADIVSKCKEVAQRYGRGDELAEKNALDTYSYWFQTAYAEPKRRQKYLHDLIHGKPITHASFRLAHLLLSNKISNLVVTTNFDDFLAKALTLFGEPHIVCDHPQTVRRINHNEALLQIVHLHGSYWFYDCCNLRGEVEERALQSQQTTSTMASLLNVIMWDRSPLVIGYSGWEGDVFMESLKLRLATPLSSNIYWFCYSKSTVNSLPDWVKQNPQIWFVVPTPKSVAKPAANDLELSSELRSAAPGIQAKSGGVRNDEDTLPADTVLLRLIQAFNLDAPELTKDPLGFFAARLENSLPTGDVATDIYAIKSVIERVRTAKKREAESEKANVKPSASTLEQVRDALRRADFREAVKQGANIVLNTLKDKDLNELADAMWSAAVGLFDNSEEELLAYNLVVTIRDTLSERTGAESGATRMKVAEALMNTAVSLGTLKRVDEEIAAYDRVIERFIDAEELEVKEQVAGALIAKGISLEQKNQMKAAIALYDQLVQQYRDAPQLELQKRVAQALIQKGACLGSLGQTDEEFELYDLVVEQYGSESGMRGEVALAFFSKAIALGNLNRIDEAISYHDQVLLTLGDAPEDEARELMAKALFNKSLILSNANRREEALEFCQLFIDKYETATDPMLQELVSRTLNNMAFNLIVIAKAFRLQGDEEAAFRELSRAESNIIKALEKEKDNGMRLGNQAYIAFLMGRKDEAKKLLTRAISSGGEKIRQNELDDAYINELPEDAEFRKMVSSIS
jgi:tetratricopeptide (TPR) repeat protein